MRTLSYLAVLEPSADGYGIFFPDLPGCVSFGSDIQDAQKMAQEALELHIYGMEKDGEEIPAPSASFPAEEVEGCILTAVTIFPDMVRHEMDSRRVKTNVTIPLWLKEKAEAQKVNYSKLLESSLLEYLGLQRA